MCLCLHGPDITAASREKPFYITVHILKKKIISTCCPLNDVYSFKKKKRVSLCQELCLSWLGLYQQYFLQVIPPAVGSLVIWPHLVQWSNRAIIQPWKENKMWTQATWRVTWVCVHATCPPFNGAFQPAQLLCCGVFVCVCMYAILIAGWGNLFTTRLTSHTGGAHMHMPIHTHTHTHCKRKGKQLEKLNKRPVLRRAGCAQQGVWRGWMGFTSQVSSYENLWNADRRAEGQD